jgi:glutamate dehydrogenase/leucine dehydrogenase
MYAILLWLLVINFLSSMSTQKPLDDFLARIDTAITTLKIDPSIALSLRTPYNIIDTTLSVTTEKGEEQFHAYRVQYNNARGPYKGGIRFHPHADLAEVTSLAGAMAVKCAVVGIPLGGGKGGVQFNPKDYSTADVHQVAAAWARAMAGAIGPHKDIPAPDVNTNPEIMAVMLQAYEKEVGESAPGTFTGKPIILGGSAGRTPATGQGGVYVLMKYLSEKGIDHKGMKVAIQGMGNVGSFAAKILHEEGFTIVGVSDSRGGVYNPEGIDAHLAAENKANRAPLDTGIDAEPVDGDIFVEVDCDILIVAALEGSLHEENANNIKAGIILELANGPTTKEADEIFESRDVVVIPDVLANAGGVTVSYFEWMQNNSGWYWDDVEVQEKLQIIMDKALLDVLDMQEKYQTTMRDGAYLLGVGRLVEAMSLRSGLSL